MTSICKKQEIIKIKIYWPFGDDISIFKHMSNMLLSKKKIQLVLDESESHYNIIINGFKESQNINLSKSIFIEASNNLVNITEPLKKMFLKYVTLNEMLDLGTYLSSFDFEELQKLKINKISNNLSCCISNNYVHFGETQIHDFLIFIQNKNFNMDILGQSLFPLKIKDDINKSDLGKGLIPYKYTIVYEHKIEPNTFSEKIFDAILSECFVFYFGCLNIENWVSSDCFLRLELNNFENDLKLIRKTIESRTWEKRIDSIKKEKQRIIKKYNLLNSIEKIIDAF